MGNFYTDMVRRDPRYYLAARCSDLSLLETGTKIRVLSVLDEAASRGVHLR
jgi:hypothetical protein